MLRELSFSEYAVSPADASSVLDARSYSTYRALLHYLYTDSISFSPLASTYYVAKDYAATNSLPFPYASRRAYLLALSPPSMPGIAASNDSNAVAPCSAKAIYRLSDKMGLVELKERAFEHIVSSLNAQNVSAVARVPPSRCSNLVVPRRALPCALH